MAIKDMIKRAKEKFKEGLENRRTEMREQGNLRRVEKQAYYSERYRAAEKLGQVKARMETNRKIHEYKERSRPSKAKSHGIDPLGFSSGLGSDQLLIGLGGKPTSEFRVTARSEPKYRYRRYRVKSTGEGGRKRRKSSNVWGDNILGI